MKTHNEILLKENKLSLTAVRLAVLDTLQAHPHSDATYIYSIVKEKIVTSSLQAIYNNLNTLVAYGIVREIKPKGRPSLYETQTGDNHHHLVCRHCKTINDADCLDVAPCLTPKDNHGFVIDEAEVILWGTCPECQTQNKIK